MPSLGADMTSGTVVEWLVKPGDEVRRGQIVAVVDTDKAAIEVEAYEEGVVTDLVVPVGATVAVGAVLARLAPLRAGVMAPPAAEPALPAEPAPAHSDGAPAVSSPLVRRRAHQLHVDLDTVPGTGPDGAIQRAGVTAASGGLALGRPRVRSSPLARRRARELGVLLDSVTGTGPRGAVRVADVERASPRAPQVPTPIADPAKPQQYAATARAEATARRQAAVGELMARSKRDIPHFYLGADVDLAVASAWLHNRNRDRPPAQRVLPAALFLRAVTVAAAEVGHLNGHWVEGGFQPIDGVHLGVAVSLRDGSLVAPGIRDAQRLDLDEMMEALRDLVVRARSGRLTREQMSDPSITVTNLGDLGVDTVLPVIYPPQVAMVGFGRVADRPWAVDGMLAVRPVVSISLAADHRASDGHRAARFLQAVARRLQCPAELDPRSAP